ncbi:hypothetical protein EJ04DRAFT_517011 [Polyplosphaeria fusca]|uniref:Uncharacterized protein n=1 Tax=Polyplosphaeria fusca TaxID=682080 RepID=A0A9P4QIB2_9PLEO|nr:hypothetical protein EJ04DRAFT_517011 [Polyplosphaeria fusca]
MPVTLRPRSDLAVNPVAEHRANRVSTTRGLLMETGGSDATLATKILASTIPATSNEREKFVAMPPSTEPLHPRSGCRNSLVDAALHAYLEHHHLIIRPEDVWFAILAQFSIYINANAERARDIFVDHDGKMALYTDINPGEYGHGVRSLASAIQRSVKMQGLKDWALPAFSTTTETDVEVASVMLMGSMQHYFTYGMGVVCGLPRVTLLGERQDYQDMSDRLPFLKDMELGPEVTLWALHLERVLGGFVNSFDGDTAQNVDFWNSMTQHHPTNVCGHSPSISGWLTAFCFWNDKGKELYKCSRKDMDAGCNHFIRTEHIPSGLVSVPVTIDGDGPTKDCRMYAGLAGIEYKTVDEMGNQTAAEEIGVLCSNATPNSVQPISGWWLCEALSAEDKRKERAREMEEYLARYNLK